MECNKEEAIRARDIAETKFKNRDFVGAKRFALKAVSLSPSMEGISQMLAVIEVHMVSQQVIGDGETDWYGILQVDLGASEAAIKGQYKKLALLLHPDKNSSPGAESAFKLLGEAWKILSDKNKKFIHDSRRKASPSSNVSHYVDLNRSSGQSSQSKPDANAMARDVEERDRARREIMTQMKAAAERKMELEKKIQEKSVRKENEVKRKTEEKEKKKWEREQKKERDKEMKKMKEMQKKKLSNFVIIQEETDVSSDFEDKLHCKGGQFSRESGGSHGERLKQGAAQRGAREARPQQGAHETRLRSADKKDSRHQPEAKNPEVAERVENHTAKRKKNWYEVDPPELEEARARPRRKSLEPEKDQKFQEQEDGFTVLISKEVHPSEITTAGLPAYDPSVFQDGRQRPSGSENLHAIIPEEIVKASLDQAIGGLRENELDHDEDMRYGNLPGNFPSNAARGKSEQNPPDEKEEKSTRRILKDTHRKHPEEKFEISTRMTRSKLLEKGKQVFGTEEARGNSWSQNDTPVDFKRRYSSEPGVDHADADSEAIEVLPSQFHDFDNLRNRLKFRKGQTWAVYDDKDGMPRFYCRLTRITRSSSPFKAKFVWLEPTSETEEKNPNSWLKGNRFAIACGEFEAGEEAVTEHVNIFSHCVFENLREDPVFIYPVKEEIWAIYSDGDQKLRGKHEAPANGQDVEQSYELVEIIEDFSDQRGVVAVRLTKTPGFCAVFHQQEGPGAMQHFSPSQLPAFSHRILSGKVPTEINLGVSVPAWELDTAALPPSMILTPASSP